MPSNTQSNAPDEATSEDKYLIGQTVNQFA